MIGMNSAPVCIPNHVSCDYRLLACIVGQHLTHFSSLVSVINVYIINVYISHIYIYIYLVDIYISYNRNAVQ